MPLLWVGICLLWEYLLMNLLVFFIWVVLFLGKWSGLIKIRLGICLKGSISILSSDLRKMVYTEIPKFIFM
jgi:hypothetical protein